MEPRTNLHSHTQFCDGRASMQDMAEAARKAGFETWGFSPHGPIDIPSPCNMREEDVSAYLAEVRRLRSLYPEMKMPAGMEIDFLDAERGPASSQVKGYGLDYVIGSVHFIPNQRGEYHDIDGSPERFAEKLTTVFEGDLDYVVRTFWKQTESMIDAGGFDIVGHIDKIAANASFVRPFIEQEEEYRRLAWHVIRKVADAGVSVEINTKQRQSAGRFFPHPRFWAYLKGAGVDMPFNSDAHHPDRTDAGLSEAQRLMDAIVESEATGLPFVRKDDTVVADFVDLNVAAELESSGIRQLYARRITLPALRMFRNVTVDYDVLVEEDSVK